MNTYLVIKDERVINTILWDGKSEWPAPDDTNVEIAPSHVGIGWTRINGTWIAPEPPSRPLEDPAKASARSKLASLGLTEDEIKALLG